MDEVVLGILVAVLVNGLFDAIVVARLAGDRAPKATNRAATSGKLEPTIKVISDRVRKDVLASVPTKPDFEGIRAEILTLNKKVSDSIEGIRADMGHMHAELSAEMPPNIDGRVKEMEDLVVQAVGKIDTAVAQIAQIDQATGAAFNALDHKLGVIFGEAGANEAALRAMSEKVSEDVEGAMQGAMTQLDTRNPMVRQFYVLATKPIDEKWAAKHPFAAMLVQGGKLWFGQNVLPELTEGASDMPQLSRASKGEKIL